MNKNTFYIYTHRSTFPTSYTDNSLLQIAKNRIAFSALQNLRYWTHERDSSHVYEYTVFTGITNHTSN